MHLTDTTQPLFLTHKAGHLASLATNTAVSKPMVRQVTVLNKALAGARGMEILCIRFGYSPSAWHSTWAWGSGQSIKRGYNLARRKGNHHNSRQIIPI